MPGVMTDNPLIARLATYRLEHDLSFEQLAALMEDAGYPMRARALHLLLTKRLRTSPRDRTLYKIQRFLDKTKTAKRGRREQVA
jgi:hypothetical protein